MEVSISIPQHAISREKKRYKVDDDFMETTEEIDGFNGEYEAIKAPECGGSFYIPSSLARLSLGQIKTVLSMDTLYSIVTDEERQKLLNYLPQDDDIDGLLRKLLNGDEFGFNSPLADTLDAIRSGKWHTSVQLEASKVQRLQHALQIQRIREYHNDMVLGLIRRHKTREDERKAERKRIESSKESSDEKEASSGQTHTKNPS